MSGIDLEIKTLQINTNVGKEKDFSIYFYNSNKVPLDINHYFICNQ